MSKNYKGTAKKIAELNFNIVAENEEEALQGARDIIAEWVSENDRARNTVRRSFDRVAVVKAKVVKGKEEEGEKFTDYFDYSEPLRKIPSHRMLAIRRGEAEGILKVAIEIPEEETIEDIKSTVEPIIGIYGHKNLYYDIVRTGRKLWISVYITFDKDIVSLSKFKLLQDECILALTKKYPDFYFELLPDIEFTGLEENLNSF